MDLRDEVLSGVQRW